MRMRLISEKEDVQDRVIDYLQSIGWDYIPPKDIQNLRGFDIKEPFLIPILQEKLRDLNKKIVTEENVSDIIRRLRILPSNLQGNEEFLDYLRGRKTVYVEKEKRERNIKFIDYEEPENNNFAFTKEFWFKDKEKKRLDIFIFINGLPIADIEVKSPTLREAEEEALVQIREYNDVLPELFKYLQFYALSEGIRLFYGPVWNYESKTFYRWKAENEFKFEKLIKTFFNRREILNTLESYVVFLRIDEETLKYILKQHQRRAIRKVLIRVIKEKDKKRGLIWHTQGAYKTLTMIVSADEIRKFSEFQNPTILAVVDRLELESQIHQNFKAFGFPNVIRAKSKSHLQKLLSSDYRGLIITTIQKFEGISKHINLRDNIILLIDEAHRSQEGDLGNYMRAALPNAYYFGYTGTPIDRGKIGRGTFVAFGFPDEPYLDKYSIDESIDEKTTVPLYYTLVKTERQVDKQTLEDEFFKIIEEEGIASIEGVNRIIKKSEKLKAVLKSYDGIRKISKHIAEHYRKFVEPLGFKAFIVAVDREACAMYKEAINEYLPIKYTQVVYTRDHRDKGLKRKYHISDEEEKRIRKAFKSPNEFPKILIVTQKLLTGYDAPVLYAMYLDKPLKDHTLLQAIARVNRPYETKTCGLIVDYIGIFENLQRALAFDSKDIGRGLMNIERLKERFKELMESVVKIFDEINLHDEKNRIPNIIEYFFDEDKRNKFVKLFKQIQEIYEILSPDEFLRDYIDIYKSLVQVYEVVYNTFNPEAERKRIQYDILKKTEELIKKSVELKSIADSMPLYEINKDIANLIKADKLSDRVKIANLHRSLVIHIDQNKKSQPFLISIAEKIDIVINQLRERQRSVESALQDLIELAEEITSSQEEQVTSGLSREEFSIFWTIKGFEARRPQEISKEIQEIFIKYKEWIYNEKMERELRIELYKLLKGKVPSNMLVEIVEGLLRVNRSIEEESI